MFPIGWLLTSIFVFLVEKSTRFIYKKNLRLFCEPIDDMDIYEILYNCRNISKVVMFLSIGVFLILVGIMIYAFITACLS
jgi:hypothetical protein